MSSFDECIVSSRIGSSFEEPCHDQHPRLSAQHFMVFLLGRIPQSLVCLALGPRGSVQSLTQIIPAYNEVVIPSVEFLRAGSEPEDARNASPDDQPGLGDLTVPPAGDGVNSNLAFMISQFPDEWVFLAKRLHAEGRVESAESQDPGCRQR